MVKDIVREVIEENSNALRNTVNQEVKGNEFLNVKEASAFLNLAVPTLYEKTSQRLIPHFKKGSRLMFKKSELIAWLEAGKVMTRDDYKEEVLNQYNTRQHR